MNVKFSKQFDKQIDKLKNAKQKEAISEAVQQMLSANALSEIPNIKKMKGHDTAFRMRVGDFRIGFFVESNNEIMVSTFLHRKDIYKKFP